LANLTGKVGSLTNQLTEASASKDQTTRMLQDEIRRKSEELEEKEAAAKALEERFAERIRSTESELTEQREQLAKREMELAGLTAKVSSLTSQLMNAGESKDETTRRLEEEAREKAEMLHAKEASLKALEARLSGTVRSLEGQLSEKQELLETREMEFEALMSNVNSLASKVQELEQARGRALCDAPGAAEANPGEETGRKTGSTRGRPRMPT
jgi:chromosome segregation ATPase